ncbi:MAG: Rieske (2Fe-2S) protein [Nocardioidaceae bacterium]
MTAVSRVTSWEFVMSEPDQRAEPSRRTVLTGLALAGAAGVPLLSACEAGQAAERKPGDTIASVAEVPKGGGFVDATAQVVVTQPTPGTFKGFSAICTHQHCLLAGVRDGTINCGCHGSKFSITTGAPVVGPSGSPANTISALPKVPVKVVGKEIELA